MSGCGINTWCPAFTYSICGRTIRDEAMTWTHYSEKERIDYGEKYSKTEKILCNNCWKNAPREERGWCCGYFGKNVPETPEEEKAIIKRYENERRKNL